MSSGCVSIVTHVLRAIEKKIPTTHTHKHVIDERRTENKNNGSSKRKYQNLHNILGADKNVLAMCDWQIRKITTTTMENRNE